MRYCRHLFRRDNLIRWFENSIVCPLCRHDIREGLDGLVRSYRSNTTPTSTRANTATGSLNTNPTTQVLAMDIHVDPATIGSTTPGRTITTDSNVLDEDTLNAFILATTSLLNNGGGQVTSTTTANLTSNTTSTRESTNNESDSELGLDRYDSEDTLDGDYNDDSDSLGDNHDRDENETNRETI